MHRHDLDAIAALADGTLQDETAARALIESCQECRAEYESQRAVLTALSSVEAAVMTETEKAALHRDLWTALPSGQVPQPSKSWWYRLSYATAGLFVVIGVAAVISQTGASDNAETLTGITVGLDAADADAEAVDERQAESVGGAATEQTYAAAAPDQPLDYTAIAELVRTDSDALSYSNFADDETASAPEEMGDCVLQAGLEDERILGAIESFLLTVPVDADIGPDTPITFIQTDTCTVVHVEE